MKRRQQSTIVDTTQEMTSLDSATGGDDADE